MVREKAMNRSYALLIWVSWNTGDRTCIRRWSWSMSCTSRGGRRAFMPSLLPMSGGGRRAGASVGAFAVELLMVSGWVVARA
jgi:hypothetical protein